MLYYLFEYLENEYQLPGASLFQFLSFRAALAVIISLLFSTIFGKKIIDYLKRKQIGETVRELGLEGQSKKSGTPTMGGIIIIISTLIPVLLIAKIQNIYILLLIFTTLWMGVIGFLDDYIKVFRKDKQGLKGIFKVIGQIFLGVIVGSTLYFHSEVTVRLAQSNVMLEQGIQKSSSDQKSTLTTIPFLKNNEFDYAELIQWIPNSAPYSWIIFIIFYKSFICLMRKN